MQQEPVQQKPSQQRAQNPTTLRLKHTPPHHNTPPSSSKRHQRHGQSAGTPPRTQEKTVQARRDPTPRRSLKEPHQYQYPLEGNHGDGDNDGLEDEYFVPSSRLINASKPTSARSASSRHSSAAKPISARPANNRHSSATTPSRTKTLPHRTIPSATNDDTGSEMTRSSSKSEALRAMQDQINEMKKQLDAKNKPHDGFHEQSHNGDVEERTPERQEMRYGNPPRLHRRELDAGLKYGMPNERRTSDVGSSRSEAYQGLREELDDLKKQLQQKQSIPSSYRDHVLSADVRTPSRHQSAPADVRTPSRHQTAPLRDSLRETLRQQYIPQTTTPLRDLPPQSPLRQTYNKSQIGQHRSPYRTTLPPKLHPSDLEHSPPPAVSYNSPAISHNAYGGGRRIDEGSPYLRTRNESCPTCGGSGSHTHGQYQYTPHAAHPPSQPQAPPPQPQAPPPTQPHFQPQPTMYSPMQTTPSGYTFIQAPPVVTSTPIVNPHHETLHQSYAPPPAAQPTLQQNVPGHQYVTQNGMQPTHAQSVPLRPAEVHIR